VVVVMVLRIIDDDSCYTAPECAPEKEREKRREVRRFLNHERACS